MNLIHTLLRESIDYAGLFPPAELDMAAAVENYARYRSGAWAWALGRFIVPVRRLPELEAAASKHLSLDPASPAWSLGVLVGPSVATDVLAVAEFNRRHARAGTRIAADAVELKASSVDGIEDIMRQMAGGLDAYIEIPIDRDPAGLIAAIGRLGARAKVRTGGVTTDAFPRTSDLTRFLQRCVASHVPFKATAGLHHPLRAEYRLTYAPGSPSGTMFGFLNVFLATALLQAGMGEADAVRLLEERSPEAFQVDDQGISWRGHRVDLEAMQRARRDGIESFGSCSFTEPITDLQALKLLEPRVQQA